MSPSTTDEHGYHTIDPASLHAELVAIAADLKNCARDTTGLMYESVNGELRLRDYVATADTNSPPEDCDTSIWAARSRVLALLDRLEDAEAHHSEEHPPA